MTHAVNRRALALVVVVALVGCSKRPARVHVPELDPQAAGAEALKLYDKNRDALLDAEELKACPGLQSCAKWVDTNSDGKVSAEEIVARVESYVGERVGRMSFTCTFKQGGRALDGAEITLEPEPFLGDALKPAIGKTGPDGTAMFMVEGVQDLGVPPGMYRVKVTKAGATVPAKYNTETTLGVEANSMMLSDDEHRKTRSFQL